MHYIYTLSQFYTTLLSGFFYIIYKVVNTVILEDIFNIKLFES